MTPGARIQAVAELLDRIERPPPAEQDLPADAVLNAYFRSRRYIGAKDRRVIGDAVFQTLRQRGTIDWWLGKHAGLPVESRFRALWVFNVHHGMSADAMVAACDGGPHRPVPLDADAARRLALLEQSAAEAPEALPDQASFPAWLVSEIERQFGADAWAEMIALTQPAPTDLRANSLTATRDKVQEALAAANIEAAPTPYSPFGLRLERRANLAGLRGQREGWFEVQDESSQIAALLVGAEPGMRVLDLCAGAGGKTLALAAEMKNRGAIVACDTDTKRLARLAPRLARSGARIVETGKLDASGHALARLGDFDRVLVDAPCSGSGTWRRRPEAKWRLTPALLAAYIAIQAQLLRDGAARVKPGGRLVYAVCSLLPTEGRERVEAFLAETGAAFGLVDAGAAWRAALGTEPPFSGPYMLLTPHRHRTDGFFAAVLERRA